ncbi:gliding motility-associated C-terminal domain-containing protein [Flavobacterium sp. RHBU_24]|uniref:gliding motility-associated C-terminal domain-containing protein n=1 Tax=Flavobacterium sp. RHBU_24 TaxID=3391185 RepID=UPI00398468C5
MNKFFTFFLVNLLFTGLFAYAQPPAFTISGTSVAQTCLGNGSISLTVIGNDPEAAMEYAVYLLPNTTNPVTTVTVPQVAGLVAGSYQVIATQLLNGESNTATTTVVVGSNVVPLQCTATGIYCNGNGTITVNVTSGSAASYQILSGPVTMPLQPSNTFTGLPMGQYQVRVFDNCGEGIVTTVQMSVPPSSLWLLDQSFGAGALPSCNSILVYNYYGSNNVMLFPVTFEYTVYPPGGGTPAVVNATQAQYNDAQTVTVQIPYYGTQQYTYNLKLTDACGNNITKLYTVNQPPAVSLTAIPQVCGTFTLDVGLNHYIGPYTVTFLSAPPGFNPLQYNSQHPVFSDPAITYGTEANTVPSGSYTVQITDACGRTFTKSIDILDNPVAAYLAVFDGKTGCDGSILIKLPLGRIIVSGEITAGPPGFTPIPMDVSAYINQDELTIGNLPLGTYTVVLTDQCGTVYTVNATITAPPVLPLMVYSKPGCGTDEGTFSAGIYYYSLQQAFITQAPAAFNEVLPFDTSMYISPTGWLTMGSIPAGTYHLTTTDYCGNVRDADFVIQGYEIYNNAVEIIRNCGSFDVDIQFSANNTNGEGLWLEVYNEETSNWENPATGFPVSYAGGLALQNNQVNYNFPYQGQFRIRHTFGVDAFGNSEEFYTSCSEEIYTFSYYDAPKIVEAYAFPCTNGFSEVVVYAEGKAPLLYQITEKNGIPFLMNGQGNVFSALEDATYTFTVTDACNNIVNRIYDITDLKALEIIPQGFCPGEASSLSVREFSFLTYQWWRAGSPNQILSTSPELLFPAFNPQTQGGTYYLKIVSTTPGSCIDTILEYEVLPIALPNSGSDMFLTFCNQGQEIDLADFLDAGTDTDGAWQDTLATGALNGSVVSFNGLDAGQYQFSYITSGCNSTDEAMVNLEIVGINSFPVEVFGNCVDGNYTIVITNIAEIDANTIEWTGPGGYNYTGETANIDSKEAGVYTVTVTNTSGCVSTASIPVDNTNCFIPRGVSPDDDGNNDSFDLSNLEVRHIKIFNRYGMEVYEKDNYINEWHGQSDKGDLPTGTYFYIITLADKQVTGWVYLQKKV